MVVEERYNHDKIHGFYGENQGTSGKERYNGEPVITVSVTSI